MIGAASFKAAVGRFATGVTVVTAGHGPRVRGMTANAFASLSLDPPLVLLCVERDAVMHDVIRGSEGFAVSVLAEGQERLARYFADSRRPEGAAQFEEVAWHAGERGLPLLDGAVAHLECALHDVLPGGDHSIVVGRVRRARVTDAPPLVYHAGTFGGFAPGR